MKIRKKRKMRKPITFKGFKVFLKKEKKWSLVNIMIGGQVSLIPRARKEYPGCKLRPQFNR